MLMKDKRNRHGAVGKSSLEQHFRKSMPSQPAVRPGCARCRAPEISHNKGNDGEIGCRSKYSTCHFIDQGTASFQPYQCIPAGFFR